MKFWLKIVKENNGLSLLIFLSFIITCMGLLSPIFIIHIFNRYIAFGLEGTLTFLVLGALSVAYLEYMFRNIRHNFCSKIILNPVKSIKISALQVFFEKTNFVDFDDRKFGASLDINNKLIKALNSQNQSNILDFLFAFFILITLFFLNSVLAAIFSLIILFSITYQLKLHTRKNEYILQNSKKKTRSLNFIPEVILKGSFLRSLNALKFSAYNVSKALDSQFKNTDYISRQLNYENSMNHFLVIINSIIIIGLGSIFVVKGSLSIGTLVGFNIFASRALQILMNAQRSYYHIKNIDMYFIANKDFFNMSANNNSTMKLSKVYGNIILENVGFNFNKNSTFLFQNLNFNFLRGNISVVAGPNGSGKSTLCKLLLGSNTPKAGQIWIDNTNIQKLSPNWWKDQISYVPQNTKCINTSIIENIRLGNPELSNKDIGKLINSVGLEKSLIKSNFDYVNNLNANFSMGFHKKVHYARLLAKNAQILIIDDPLEHLDLEGKEFVLNLLSSFKKADKTIICFGNDDQILNISDKKYYLYD